MIRIDNNGPLIATTDYYQSEYAIRDLMVLSPNAGAIRVLLPRAYHSTLSDLEQCPYAIVTRGIWMGKAAVEILWEDHTDTPHMWHLTEDSCLLLPGDPAPGEWTITLWIERAGAPHCALERPCKWRKAQNLPCGKPWRD